MNKEVCWGVGGGQGSCGKRCVGGDVGKCVGVWGGGKERCVGSGEVWGGCGRVYGVSGKMCWRVGKGCGEGNGGDEGKCVEVWGPNTLLIPHISSLPSPFPHLSLHLPLLPPHPITFSYTSSHTSSHISPSSPQHIFLLSPHLLSPSQSVAKLPCDEVSVVKLPCGEVTGNQVNHHFRSIFEISFNAKQSFSSLVDFTGIAPAMTR